MSNLERPVSLKSYWLHADLTHCSLVTPYDDTNYVNIGLDNGLLLDGTKPLPEPMLTYHQYGPLTFM